MQVSIDSLDYINAIQFQFSKKMFFLRSLVPKCLPLNGGADRAHNFKIPIPFQTPVRRSRLHLGTNVAKLARNSSPISDAQVPKRKRRSPNENTDFWCDSQTFKSVAFLWFELRRKPLILAHRMAGQTSNSDRMRPISSVLKCRGWPEIEFQISKKVDKKHFILSTRLFQTRWDQLQKVKRRFLTRRWMRQDQSFPAQVELLLYGKPVRL